MSSSVLCKQEPEARQFFIFILLYFFYLNFIYQQMYKHVVDKPRYIEQNKSLKKTSTGSRSLSLLYLNASLPNQCVTGNRCAICLELRTRKKSNENRGPFVRSQVSNSLRKKAKYIYISINHSLPLFYSRDHFISFRWWKPCYL